MWRPPANAAGRPGVNKGEQAAFPMARVLAVAECGTHAIFAARVGAYSDSEATLAQELLPAALEPGMLLTADRGFFSYALWRPHRHRRQAGPPDRPVRNPSLQDLPDLAGSCPMRPADATPSRVQVIDYTLDTRARDNGDVDAADAAETADDAEAVTYRLFTTMLDPATAPAVDLANSYAQRWEIENTFDELKTHQRGPRVDLSRPTWCSKRSGATCAATTPSGR